MFLILLLVIVSITGNGFAFANDNLDNILRNNGYFNGNISDLDKEKIINNEYNKVHKYEIKNNTLINSIKNKKNNSYRLIIRSEKTLDEIKDIFSFFDKNIDVINETNGFYDINILSNSKILKNYLKGIDDGLLPSTIFDFEVVEPELIKIDSIYTQGESLSNMWGITKMGAENYQSGLLLNPKFKIGIIDTGIDYNHVDLSGNIYHNPGEIVGDGIDNDNNGYIDDVIGYDFVNLDNNPYDDQGHGTHVSGVAGGIVNGSGIFGVNSNASLVGLKVLDATGAGSSYNIGLAIRYAADNGIKVVNMSLGGRGTPSTSYLCSSIDYALSKGTISIVAAGNSNADVSRYVPAGCPNAITVSAIDNSLTKAYFSNYGSEVDVAAPGVNIYSSTLGNNYETWDGTSMATPFITGLVSVMLSYNNSLNLSSIKSIFSNSSLTDTVTSSSFIGRFANMSKIMTYLGVSFDNNFTPVDNISPTVTLSYTIGKRNTYTFKAIANDSDGSIVKYDFYLNDILYQSGTSNIFKIRSNTSFILKVVVWDNDGATGEKTININ